MRDLHSEMKFVNALTPVDRTATATGATIIDRKGFDAVTFAAVTGAVAIGDASNYFTIGVEEGDQSNLSDAAAAPAASLQGASPVINATTLANKFAGKVTYRGTKRYVRATMVETGTAQALAGVVAVLWNPDKAPVSNPAA